MDIFQIKKKVLETIIEIILLKWNKILKIHFIIAVINISIENIYLKYIYSKYEIIN